MTARLQHLQPATLAAALLLSGAVAHWAPEHLADAAGGSVRAWETVCYGLEAAALWLAVAALARQVWPSWALCLPVAGVCGVMASEGLQRAGCRLLWPMDVPLRLQEPACVAAFGRGAEWLGLAGALAAVAAVAWSLAHGR